MRQGWLLALLVLAACTPPRAVIPPDAPPKANAAGLMTLPCHATSIQPANAYYCLLGRHYVTPAVRAETLAIADRLAAELPGSHLTYMDASGASGKRPFAPHLSHGDGREIDFALFFETRAGKPLAGPPKAFGYEAFEPPRTGDPRMCPRAPNPPISPDPPASRPWRLDERRTRAMVLAFVRDPKVKRVFLEPHLKIRLGLQAENKIRFQGCRAARHDDHLHVDFY